MEKSIVKVVANKDTVALYMLSKLMKLDFIQLITLYEVFKFDVFYIFHILENCTIQFAKDRMLSIHSNNKMITVFKRAENIIKVLRGESIVVNRNERKWFIQLEKLYNNGLFHIEVLNG